MDTNIIIQGDCIEEMKKLLKNSIDAIITDPPYGLEFMGKEWDKFKEGKNIAGGNTGKDTPFGRKRALPSSYQYDLEEKNVFQQFTFNWAKECLRVLKPGAYLLSMGGTRTYHRMVCGIEDAGFEIRDCIMWIYGSGFPKSLNIGKQIDKLQGNEREVVGVKSYYREGTTPVTRKATSIMGGNKLETGQDTNIETKGNSEWEGWGTALKPACEPIVVARKPLSEKNVALNVLKWGTGGINIDACRIGSEVRINKGMSKKQPDGAGTFRDDNWILKDIENIAQGRFPSNIILDEISAKMLDEQSGDVSQGHWAKSKVTGFGDFGGGKQEYFGIGEKDKTKHGASRFFYVAKASREERDKGLNNLEGKKGVRVNAPRENEEIKTKLRKNNHPTVKPIKLMEYLVKMVTRENAVVLDPFIGSGTTGIACLKLGRKFRGIEKEKEYVKIANARLKQYLEQKKLVQFQ